jgi:hypothetical protein
MGAMGMGAMGMGAMGMGAMGPTGMMGMMGMGMNPLGMLPPFNYMNAGIPNIYNMQYQNPVFSSPYMFNQFPNYSMYPPTMMNQAFMPNWLGPASMFRQPFPMMPYGMGGMGMMGMGMGMMGMNAPFGTPVDAAKGGMRAGVGMMKMAPGLGNLLNGVDFVMDIGHLFTGRQSFMKTAADLLFHGAGMLVPQVGGAYDMAQGTIRMAAGRMMSPFGMGIGMGMGMGMLPPFAFNGMGIPPVYNSPMIF